MVVLMQEAGGESFHNIYYIRILYTLNNIICICQLYHNIAVKKQILTEKKQLITKVYIIFLRNVLQFSATKKKEYQKQSKSFTL